MQTVTLFLQLVLVLATVHCKLIDHVNVFIGTGGKAFGIGSLNPGPQLPFAMCRVGPDTTNEWNLNVDFEHFGGIFNFCIFYLLKVIITQIHIFVCFRIRTWWAVVLLILVQFNIF